MKTFAFKARDLQGKTLTGLVEARDARSAAASIREKGVVVIAVREKLDGGLSVPFLNFTKRVDLKDLATFTRQLSTMTTAGLPLTEALVILKSQAKPAFGKVIDGILGEVQGGSSLADAMAHYPDVFSRTYVSLVRTGEAAGVLDKILSRMSDNLEKQREFQGKVKGALIYPVIIILGMVVVAFVMMIFVVPKLASLYEEFGAELPLPTKILVGISTAVSSYWWILIILGVILANGLRQFGKTKIGRKRIDTFKLDLPILGNLTKFVIMTEFSRTLSLMVGSGISIIEALNIVAESLGNSLYEEKVKLAAVQVEKGLPLAFSLSGDNLFPVIVSQMVSVGEETGKMDDVLIKLSHYFETESEQMIKGLTSAVEPLIMIVLGVGVGFLVLSIILPIYNLTQQF